MASNRTKTRSVKIEVTQDHIKRGLAHSALSCPIALAAREALGNPRAVYVDACEITFGRVELYLPKKARTFVERFDASINRHRLKPISFWLRWNPDDF